MPRHDTGTLFPAMLVVLLMTIMLLQLALTHDPDLPVEEVGRLVPEPAGARLDHVAAAPDIIDRPLFSPTRRGGAAPVAGEKPADSPLGGAVVAGMASGRGFSRALLRLPDGSIVTIPLGGQFRGWRLVALTPEGAGFVRDGARIMMNYGSQAQAEAAEAEEP